jgi:hypothetical protein
MFEFIDSKKKSIHELLLQSLLIYLGLKILFQQHMCTDGLPFCVAGEFLVAASATG